ncbi:PEP-CTERM sorting domain-containing protein [Sphingoaurantiacus capsulatus]|uniref:PEP-CTERM sorting domain-containing protein n=1 Tax=Sphingoaurantiacus capsulatus TaxID=1771310 RepID=A0ABV7XF53_9SPHN
MRQFFRVMVAAVAACLAVPAAPALAAPVTISLGGTCTTSCGLDGTDGIARVFSFTDNLGLSSSARVTAWSATPNVLTGALTNWRTAFVNYAGDGLGITNQDEGTGALNNQAAIDNLTGTDFLVIRFDDNVTVTGATLNAFAMTAGLWGTGRDADASFFIGTSTVPFATSINMADTAQRLSAMTHYIEASGDTSGLREFNAGTRYSGNTLVIAASVSEANRWGLVDRPDAFKVASIRVEYPVPAPEPAAVGLFGLGVLALGVRRRKPKA